MSGPISDSWPRSEALTRLAPTRVRRHFDRVSWIYRWINFIGQSPNRFALRRAQLKGGERVLEIGFGTGWWIKRLLQMVPGIRVYGIDSALNMAISTRSLLDRSRLRASIAVADGLRIPFPEGAFDLVFASGLLDLLEPRAQVEALKEIKRVLKPGGKFLTVDISRSGDGVMGLTRRFYEWIYDRWPKLLGEYRPISRPIRSWDLVKLVGLEGCARWLTTPLFVPLPVEVVLAKKPIKNIEGKENSRKTPLP